MKIISLILLTVGFTSLTAHASCEDQASELATSLNRATYQGNPIGTKSKPQTLGSKSLNWKSLRDGGSLETVKVVYSYPTWREIYTMVFVEDYAQGDCHIDSYTMTVKTNRP